ncbi:MAG TPA: hypothetical protein PKD54_00205 [Pirellulaceae bacterium]|nr:hypothetical protein [Pirellulaceae bacterium]
MSVRRMMVGSCLMTLVCRVLCASVGFGLSVAALPSYAQHQVRLILRNGSSLTVETDSFVLKWTEFRARGSSQSQTYSLVSINRLKLSESPVSEFLETAKQLLAELGHENYDRREAAESLLKNMLEQSGNPTLKMLIEEAVDDMRLEVRFRVQRILVPTATTTPSPGTAENFDLLDLKEGRQMRGDAGDFDFKFRWRGDEFRLNRRELAEISVVAALPPHPVPATGDWTPGRGVVTYMQPSEPRPDQLITVDFERDPAGNALERGANVNDLFAHDGIRFHTPVGYIGISGYEVSFEGLPPRGNSICVYDTRGSFTRRFKGVTEISFCLPGQPTQAAGVHWFECYAARLDNPRDFVLNAFDSSGRLLATVESSDQPCSYFAIASAKPIYHIQFLSNPFLFHLKRRVDDDYALDNIAFSAPVAVPPLISARFSVGLVDGDLWCTDNLQFTNDRAIVLTPPGVATPLKIDEKEIRYVVFPHESFPDPPRSSKRWLAGLSDGSVVEVTPGKQIVPVRDSIGPMSPEDFLSIWSARDYHRLPDPSDFDRQRHVLVFPTARILTDSLLFNESEVSWPAESRRIFAAAYVKNPELVGDDGLGVDEEPPLPMDLQAINWPEPNTGHLPTIWLAPPTPESFESGPSVMLRNGELFRLGTPLGFRLQSISPAGLTIVRERDGQILTTEPIKIPLDEIHRIVF